MLGRLGDLRRRERRAGEQRLDDVLPRWSPAGNRDWLADGARRGEPFLQISAAPRGSVLAWELAELRARDYVGVGPFWLPARWLADAHVYRRTVRAAAARVLGESREADARTDGFVAKAHAELEPLLALWPHVLALPIAAPLAIDDLLRARAWPVHPFAVRSAPAWADGRWCSPAEFFCHDLDHARFKVREDLLARGVALPDAYRGGSTWDAARAAHRLVLPAARWCVDGDGWRRAPARAARLRAWLAAIAAERGRDRPLAEAARWLLFELLHEKSLPVEVAVLARALAGDEHVAKLRRKCAAGFHGGRGPDAAAVARLADARPWLARVLAQEPA